MAYISFFYPGYRKPDVTDDHMIQEHVAHYCILWRRIPVCKSSKNKQVDEQIQRGKELTTDGKQALYTVYLESYYRIT